MVDESAIHFLENIAVAAILLWFFTGPWQTYFVDASRLRCLELQNQLHDLAVGGRVAFDSPVYRELWQYLEDRIHAKYAITVTDLIAVFLVFGRRPHSSDNLSDAIRRVEDKSLQAELKNIYSGSIGAQVQQALARSPTLIVLTLLAPIVLLAVLLGMGTRVVFGFNIRSAWRIVVDLTRIANYERSVAQRATARTA